jgi:hypothetical protein
MMSKKVAFALSAAMAMSVPLFGDAWNKKTTLTFNQPVELPGVILPAGQYVFKLADFATSRNVVQVFNAEEDQIYATILAVPSYRMDPADELVILFEERRSDQPQAIHAWFYPGELYGREFVYPEGWRLEASRTTDQPVLSAELQHRDTPVEPEKTVVAEMSPEIEEKEKPVEIAETRAAELTPPIEPVAIAENVEQETSTTDESELPKTATSLPFLSLLGAGGLGIAGILKLLRIRDSK